MWFSGNSSKCVLQSDGESLRHLFMLIWRLVHICTLWDAYGHCAGYTDHETKPQQFTKHTAGAGCGFPESKGRSGSSVWIVS